MQGQPALGTVTHATTRREDAPGNPGAECQVDDHRDSAEDLQYHELLNRPTPLEAGAVLHIRVWNLHV